jgi:hypothetical protein
LYIFIAHFVVDPILPKLANAEIKPIRFLARTS